jgi:FkbM family methyltransferase
MSILHTPPASPQHAFRTRHERQVNSTASDAHRAWVLRLSEPVMKSQAQVRPRRCHFWTATFPPVRLPGWVAASRKPRLVTVMTDRGPFICWEGDAMTSRLRKFGAHQRSDLAMVVSFVRSGDWVIDVGAHIGTFSVPLGKAVGQQGRVFAFEGAPENFDLLQQNIRGNDMGDVVKPINAVVTQGHSALRMTRTQGRSGSTEFFHSNGEELTGVPQIGLDSWWQGCDHASRHISLIKIDVEGMEYDVLRSGEHLVASHKPVVVFEVSVGRPVAGFDDPDLGWMSMDEYFADNGYDLFVNLHVRNCKDDVFELDSLRKLTPTDLPHALVDIVAVPRDSARHP